MESFVPLKSIIDGISKKLNLRFGDKYTIYPESVKQGLERPCFFIQLLNPTNMPERGEIYQRDNLFCIHFFPESVNEPNDECYQMLETLYSTLEYIEVDGGLVRGIRMNGRIHD